MVFKAAADHEKPSEQYFKAQGNYFTLKNLMKIEKITFFFLVLSKFNISTVWNGDVWHQKWYKEQKNCDFYMRERVKIWPLDIPQAIQIPKKKVSPPSTLTSGQEVMIVIRQEDRVPKKEEDLLSLAVTFYGLLFQHFSWPSLQCLSC